MILHTQNKQKGLLYYMTTFDLDNEIKVVNEQKIIDLTNR